MSSHRVPSASLKLPLPKKPAPIAQIFCPSNTFSMGIPTDSRVITTEIADIAGPIIANRIKNLSEQVSESAVERTMVSELNRSELSLLYMLEGGNGRHFEDTSSGSSGEEKRLREEVEQLKKDLIMKSSLIEKLMTENASLRKEMDEVLSTVEDAKGKINMRLNGYSQRILELEKEVKALSEENKQYQEQLQKVNNASKEVNVSKEVNPKQYLKKVEEQIYQSLNEQLSGLASPSRAQYLSSTNLKVSETNKENSGHVRSRHGSPGHVRPNLSISKPKNAQQQHARSVVRQPSAANNSPVAQERSGAVNKCTRRNKMLTLHHIQDAIPGNKSENNCGGVFSSSDFCGKRSPKAVFTPNMKVKVIGYEFDDSAV